MTMQTNIDEIETKNTEQDDQISELGQQQSLLSDEVLAATQANTDQDNLLTIIDRTITDQGTTISALQQAQTTVSTDIDLIKTKNTE